MHEICEIFRGIEGRCYSKWVIYIVEILLKGGKPAQMDLLCRDVIFDHFYEKCAILVLKKAVQAGHMCEVTSIMWHLREKCVNDFCQFLKVRVEFISQLMILKVFEMPVGKPMSVQKRHIRSCNRMCVKIVVAIFKIARFFCRIIKYYGASKGTTRNLLW